LIQVQIRLDLRPTRQTDVDSRGRPMTLSQNSGRVEGG
jgi:hypothetical protein